MAQVKDVRVTVGHYSPQQVLAELSFDLDTLPEPFTRGYGSPTPGRMPGQEPQYAIRIEVVDLAAERRGQGNARYELVEPLLHTPQGTQRLTHQMLLAPGHGVVQPLQAGPQLNGQGPGARQALPGGQFPFGTLVVDRQLRICEGHWPLTQFLGMAATPGELPSLLALLSPGSSLRLLQLLGQPGGLNPAGERLLLEFQSANGGLHRSQAELSLHPQGQYLQVVLSAPGAQTQPAPQWRQQTGNSAAFLELEPELTYTPGQNGHSNGQRNGYSPNGYSNGNGYANGNGNGYTNGSPSGNGHSNDNGRYATAEPAYAQAGNGSAYSNGYANGSQPGNGQAYGYQNRGNNGTGTAYVPNGNGTLVAEPIIDYTQRQQPQAEGRLRELESRLNVAEQTAKGLFESAPIGICITNEEGMLEQVNDTYCAIYGYKREELEGQPFTKVVPKDQAGKWKKTHDDFLRGNNHTRGEFAVINRHGKPITILADSARTIGDDGRPRKITFVIDISERKRAEESLRLSEDRLQSLVNAAPVGICVTDAEGNFVNINETYCAIYGYTPEELLGKPFTLVVPKDQAAKWKQTHDRFLAGETHTRGEFQVLTKANKRLTILADSARIQDNNGNYQKVTYVLDITERKRAEEALRLSELRLQSLVNAAPVGICVTDAEGNFVNINETYCAIYGYTPEELLGKSFTMVVPKEQAGKWLQTHERFLAGETHTRGEFQVLTKAGKKLTILADSARIQDNAGNYQKVTYVLDITERKRGEEALRLSEDRLMSLVNSAPVGICVTNREGLLETVNETYAAIYGYTIDELVGKPFTLVVPRGHERQWMQTHDKFLAGETHTRGEFNVFTKTGRQLTILADSARIIGADGDYRKVTYVLDITERKRNEEALRLSELRLQSLVNSAPVGICVTDASGCFVNVNDTYCAIYGYRPEELIGQPFTVVVPKADHQKWLSTHDRFLAGEVHTRGEFNVFTKTGKQLTILADSARIQDNEGNFQKVTYVLDITERKRNELELQFKSEELRQNVEQLTSTQEAMRQAQIQLSVSEALNRSMIETAPVGICVTNAGGNFETVNDTYCLIYGYTREELEGRPFTMVVPKEDTALWNRKHDEFLAGRDETRGEFTVRAKDGRSLTILADSVRIIGTDGEPKKVTFVLDITERKRAENELQAKTAELKNNYEELQATQEAMRRAQVELTLSENVSRSLIETAPVGVAIVNQAGDVEMLNTMFCTIFGYSEHELMGRAFHTLAPKKEQAAWSNMHVDFMAGGGEIRGEFVLADARGRSLFTLVECTRITGLDGHPKRVTFVVDITRLKENELEARKLSLIAARTDNGIFTATARGEVEWINDGFTRITGLNTERVQGKSWDKVLAELGASREALDHIRAEVSQGRSVNDEVQIAQGWLSLSLTPVFSDSGLLEQFVAILNDVTEKKKREEELAGALREIKNAQEQLLISEKMAALGQLIAGVAHEVNTPISAVKASVGNMMRMLPETISDLPTLLLKIPKNLMPLFKQLVTTSVTSDIVLTTKEERTYRRQIADLLEENGIDNAEEIADNLVEIRVLEDIEQYLPLLENKASLEILDMAYKLGQLKVNMTNIDIASEKTAKVVMALKNYSHIQSTDRLVETVLGDSLDTILMLYHNQTKYGIEVVRNYSMDESLFAYPDEIGQVWTNIIQNAIQAMKGQGTLTVETERVGQSGVVRIIDNGPGIPKDIQARIFEPFFTTKSQGEGTGLGLDITRKIVEKHRGTIGVESEPGRTCFTISIPVNLNELIGDTEA